MTVGEPTVFLPWTGATLGHLKAVVHGCDATLAFADDHTSPVPLLFVAEEEAQIQKEED